MVIPVIPYKKALLGWMGGTQGVKVGTLGRQNERNSSYVRLAHTSIFGLCFMSVCLMKSNCYSLICSSLLRRLKNISQKAHISEFQKGTLGEFKRSRTGGPTKDLSKKKG